MVTCRLAVLLAEKRWTQRELIRRTGLHHKTISRLYRDQWQELNRNTIDNICGALNITLSELFQRLPSQRDGEG